MTSHISEELPGLLTGEATRDVVLDAAEHLRGCPDCQQELVSAVVAHASLSSAHRFAPEIVARSTYELPDNEVESSQALPDLSAIFSQVRAEAKAPTSKTTSRRPLLAVAAAVGGMLIGGGAVALTVDHSGSHSSGSVAAGQRVHLAAFDAGKASALATVNAAGRMTIDATSLPNPGTQKRYEVWLTDSKRTKMQPVGWIGLDGKATLTVPADLMGRYQDIEVSVQNVNADTYDYSGTSVARGSYA